MGGVTTYTIVLLYTKCWYHSSAAEILAELDAKQDAQQEGAQPSDST
jgi:hypothetical protein